MSKKTITYKQAEELSAQANNYLLKNGFLKLDPETMSVNYTDKKMTALSSGLKNVIKQIGKIAEEFQPEFEAIIWKHCLKGKEKELLMEADGKAYKFTEDGRIAHRDAVKEIKNREIEIHQRIQLDETIDLDEYDLFLGIVVPETTK